MSGTPSIGDVSGGFAPASSEHLALGRHPRIGAGLGERERGVELEPDREKAAAE